MSAAILQDPKKQHDAEDDRESAYHLLNWLALRYTAHDKIDKLHRYLVHFDECYKDGPFEGGGDSKKNRIITPLPITFESSNLNPLLEELRKVFVVRYERPPSRAEYEALEQLEDKIKASEKVIQEADIRVQETINQLQETSAGVSSEVLNLRLALRDSQVTIRDSHRAKRDSEYTFLHTKKMELLSAKGWLVGVL